MSDQSAGRPAPGLLRRTVEAVGAAAGGLIDRARDHVNLWGGLTYLFRDTSVWLFRSLFVRKVKFGASSLISQMVRVGVRSIPIIVLVETFIGVILALQMAPVLTDYGQPERVADVTAIAIVRELGPLITAIVLSGFAGASIAAEIAAMVEGEEVKALRAHALNPIKFLVLPRVLATVVMIVGLAVIANVVGVTGGFITSWAVLDIPSQTYWDFTAAALTLRDYLTGLVKAAVFGLLVSLIACHEGLNVTGGAVGVGRATTATVVKSIVAIIGTDMVFTALFYALAL